QTASNKYITVVLGAADAYERDYLITESLQSICQEKQISYPVENKENYTINLIGDTYFGEFYTAKRQRRGEKDALQTYGRAYSFDKLRPVIEKGDFNICNFEAAITEKQVNKLKLRKPFVLHADAEKTVSAIKEEGFDLVTLANN